MVEQSAALRSPRRPAPLRVRAQALDDTRSCDEPHRPVECSDSSEGLSDGGHDASMDWIHSSGSPTRTTGAGGVGGGCGGCGDSGGRAMSCWKSCALRAASFCDAAEAAPGIEKEEVGGGATHKLPR